LAVVGHGDQFDEGAPEIDVGIARAKSVQRLSWMRSKRRERRRRDHEAHPPIQRDGGLDVVNHMADVLDAADGRSCARRYWREICLC
jgi:hypothetical protein